MRDLALVVFAILLISLRLFLQLSSHPSYPPGAVIKLTATLTQEPQTTVWNQKLATKDFDITLPRYPEFHQGDRVEIIGNISKKETPSSDSSDFSINPIIPISPIGPIVLSSVRVRLLPSRPNLFSLASSLRRLAESVYQSTLPEPAAGLMSGIVWGGRQNLSAQLIEDLRRTGTLHIVAASGMNVTLAAGFLLNGLLLFVRRRWAVLVGILGVILYLLAAGLSASVVRAGIIATLLFLSQFFGRQYNTVRIFLITIFLMLITKPLWLFDVGWQLSVAATAGLLFLHPRFPKQSNLKPIPVSVLVPVPVSVSFLSILGSLRNLVFVVLRRTWSFLAADFWVSVAALLATGPILITNFGNLSLLAPLINALVLWLIGPLMVLGFLMALGGPLATLLGWIAYILLSLFVVLIHFFGNLNWAVFEGFRLHWLFGLLYYLGLIYLLFRTSHNSNKTHNSY